MMSRPGAESTPRDVLKSRRTGEGRDALIAIDAGQGSMTSDGVFPSKSP
jgi:hypothetical protein